MVDDDANNFSIDGGILMMRDNIDPGILTAIVELRDKFSMLNPSYEDLVLTAIITIAVNGGDIASINPNAPYSEMILSKFSETVTVNVHNEAYAFNKNNPITIEVSGTGTDIFAIKGSDYDMSLSGGTKISFEEEGQVVSLFYGTISINRDDIPEIYKGNNVRILLKGCEVSLDRRFAYDSFVPEENGERWISVNGDIEKGDVIKFNRHSLYYTVNEVSDKVYEYDYVIQNPIEGKKYYIKTEPKLYGDRGILAPNTAAICGGRDCLWNINWKSGKVNKDRACL